MKFGPSCNHRVQSLLIPIYYTLIYLHQLTDFNTFISWRISRRKDITFYKSYLIFFVYFVLGKIPLFSALCHKKMFVYNLLSIDQTFKTMKTWRKKWLKYHYWSNHTVDQITQHVTDRNLTRTLLLLLNVFLLFKFVVEW
jgi:hypothetical protein